MKCDDEIKLEKYEYFGLNRKTLDKKAVRGSGGIGVFISKQLSNNYKYSKCFEYQDNVLGIEISDKLGGEVMIVYCIYLPPEGSKYGVNNKCVLNNLMIDIFRHNNMDDIIVCGDFNAQVGVKHDCTNFDDEIPERKPIDEKSNSQGDRLLTFINDL